MGVCSVLANEETRSEPARGHEEDVPESHWSATVWPREERSSVYKYISAAVGLRCGKEVLILFLPCTQVMINTQDRLCRGSLKGRKNCDVFQLVFLPLAYT